MYTYKYKICFLCAFNLKPAGNSSVFIVISCFWVLAKNNSTATTENVLMLSPWRGDNKGKDVDFFYREKELLRGVRIKYPKKL